MQTEMIKRAKELLADGTVKRVAGWRSGDFQYELSPSIFTDAEDLEKNFQYSELAASNMSKYMIKESRKEGKVLIFLKPCDTYSFQQLLNEHRILRDNVMIIGVECDGNLDIVAAKKRFGEGLLSLKSEGDTVTATTIYGEELTAPRAELLLERCVNCKSKKHMVFDELIGEDGVEVESTHRFDKVDELDAMSEDQRFGFWQNELSRCIRCNACRDICPACSCENCVFDNPESGFSNKGAAVQMDNDMFHIIRAFHVAGRCTDCGECSRVCPEHIPLHLLNRKFIKDYDGLYGEFQAGAGDQETHPLTQFKMDDLNPTEALNRGDEE